MLKQSSGYILFLPRPFLSLIHTPSFLPSLATQCLAFVTSYVLYVRLQVRVSYILRETLYPFLALIVLRHGRMVVCERIEGALSLDEFIERLRTSVADNEAELVVERTNRYRRQEDQQLRESQDQAFEESLAADREKQRRRDEDMWRAKQLAEEEEEEQRREEVMKEVRCPVE